MMTESCCILRRMDLSLEALSETIELTALPTLLVDTDSGVIDAANEHASRLLEEDDLPGSPFADVLGSELAKLIVFYRSGGSLW
jgi:hypothetical protein